MKADIERLREAVITAVDSMEIREVKRMILKNELNFIERRGMEEYFLVAQVDRHILGLLDHKLIKIQDPGQILHFAFSEIYQVFSFVKRQRFSACNLPIFTDSL